MPKRVRLAVLLAFIGHGAFILAARYRFSYDAYTHMFFADHYRLNWWSLWDARWYTGFTVTSYPPLVHQLIGLAGALIGVDAGYALLSWVVLAAFPLAAYAFSRVFVEPTPAEFAALGAAILPSIYLAAYTFGQLPTLTGALLALFFTAALAEYLKTGQRVSGALAVLLTGVILAAHHATLMFLPGLAAAAVLHLFLHRQVSWKTLTLRLAPVVFGAGVAGLLVIWPFWRWGLGQVMQTPIDHSSRHNFILDPGAGAFFFLSIYGPFILLIPYTLRKMFDRNFVALSAVFTGLFLLGLGGTTPIPRWLFGAGWEWLTYDRFSLWATLVLLPIFGVWVTQILQKSRAGSPAPSHPGHSPAWRQAFSDFRALVIHKRALIAIFGSLAATSVLVGLFPTILPTQPAPVDMQPIVRFLDQGSRSQWRYLTFGFGDQFAYLNRLTSATTIDGSYHTARTLPELRSSGIGSIDSVYWLSHNLSLLDPILAAAGKYGVRWGFVDGSTYVLALFRRGWVYRGRLSGGIQVWENPAAVLPPVTPAPVDDPLVSFAWGSLPMLALAIAAGLASLRLWPVPAVQVLRGISRFAVGLLPVGLVFWYFRSLTDITYPRVYFTYDNAAFFLSDALALIAVMAWALARWFGPRDTANRQKSIHLFRWSTSLAPWLLALCCLATLSGFWSRDWRISLYLGLHLWLGFGLFLCLRDQPGAWRAAMLGFCVALTIQVIAGFAEFALQSTNLLAPIHLNWPGGIEPSMRGASVVQLIDGARWLRVYGTLPHPNILGTFLVALLSAPIALYLSVRKSRWLPLLLFSSGVILLVLSFSRGAWVGFFAGALVFAIKSRSMERKRLLVLGGAGAASLLAAIFPLYPLIITRLTGAAAVPTEAFSIKGRDWLAGQALTVIQQHPVLGLGIGSFILDLSQRALPGYIIEPVHSLPLLVASELGLGGAVILVGLVSVAARQIWQARAPRAVLMSAVLVGLGAASLFDHSLWTLAPSRIFLALTLGLWAGQVEHEHA